MLNKYASIEVQIEIRVKSHTTVPVIEKTNYKIVVVRIIYQLLPAKYLKKKIILKDFINTFAILPTPTQPFLWLKVL